MLVSSCKNYYGKDVSMIDTECVNKIKILSLCNPITKIWPYLTVFLKNNKLVVIRQLVWY